MCVLVYTNIPFIEKFLNETELLSSTQQVKIKIKYLLVFDTVKQVQILESCMKNIYTHAH